MSALGQISFPVRTINGEIATVDPDGDQFVAEQVEVLCLTPLDWFPGLTGFGLASQLFRRGGADLREIERQIQEWIPEAQDLIDRDPAALDRGLDHIGIRVSA